MESSSNYMQIVDKLIVEDWKILPGGPIAAEVGVD